MRELFYRLSLWVTSLCISITVLVALLARSTASPNIDIDVLAACQLPCVLGITPGSTVITEGEAIVRRYLPTDTTLHVSNAIPGVTEISFMTTMQGRRVFGWFESVNDGIVIWGFHLQTNFPLDEMFEDLGTPDCAVAVHNESYYTIMIDWFSGNMLTRAVVALDAGEAWSFDTLVDEIQVVMSNPVACETNAMFDWRGFALVQYYWWNQ